VNYPLFVLDFNYTWICSTDFEKSTNCDFLENKYIGSRVIQCVPTDGETEKYDEAASRFPQFFESASK